MELRHIRYFITLAEELHFRKASERLFIAQPALSRQIIELEKELGVQLLKRDKRNVSLTLAGKHLQNEGYKILKQMETLQNTLSDQGKTINGTLHIGHIGSAINILIPDFLGVLNQKMPSIKTTLFEDTSNKLAFSLLDRKVDIIFCREVTFLGNIQSAKIYQEETIVAVAKNSRWKIGQSTDLSSLRNVPFILFPREAGHAFRSQIETACAQHHFFPQIIHESISSNSLLRLVEKDLGISILPKSLTKGYNLNIEFIEIKDLSIPIELFVAIRKDENDEIVKEAFKMAVDGT